MKNMIKPLLPALVLAAFSASSLAAGFQRWDQSASGLGVAYAGSAAVAEDASALYYNPAAMLRLDGLQLSAGGTGLKTRVQFHDDGSSGVLGAGGSGGDAGQAGIRPNAYLSWRLAPNWAVGLGVSSPFAAASEYGSANWTGSNQAVKTELSTVNVNPSLAYRLNDKVALGLGLNFQTLDLEFTRAATGGAYRFKADDQAVGWNAGALFTLSEAMRVGISYRSSLKYTLEGTRSLGAGSSAAEADLKLPDTLTLSVWQQVSDRWEAMGDLSYTRWGQLGDLAIQYAGGSDVERFAYRNAWRFAWGAAYRATDVARLKFGIAYERSPVRGDLLNARLPEDDRVWFSLGGQWQAGRYGRVDLGYAYLYSKEARIDQSSYGTLLRGRYDLGAHVLGLQYSAGF